MITRRKFLGFFGAMPLVAQAVKRIAIGQVDALEHEVDTRPKSIDDYTEGTTLDDTNLVSSADFRITTDATNDWWLVDADDEIRIKKTCISIIDEDGWIWSDPAMYRDRRCEK